jgi:hypothetical protein
LALLPFHDASYSILKLLFAKFGINALDVFDHGEVVASTTVLRWLQSLNQNCLKCSDNGSKVRSKCVFRELTCVGDSVVAEPRELVPATGKPVKRVLLI